MDIVIIDKEVDVLYNVSMNRYIAMDCESGGPDPNLHSLLEVALIVLDKELNEIDVLEMRVKPDNDVYTVTSEAMGVNNIDLVSHGEQAWTYKEAGTKLYEFLKKHSDNGKDKLIPIGHNVQFDIQFVQSTLISKNSWQHHVSYRVLDTGVILQFLKLTGDIPDNVSGSLQSILDYFDIKEVTNSHVAIEDVRSTVAALSMLQEYMRSK